LNWTKDGSQQPNDLDAHLIVPLPDNKCYEVSFANNGKLDDIPYAKLDIDNIQVEGRPPTETVSISRLLAGKYTFFVNNFSYESSNGLSNSRATVQIFKNSIQIASFVAPIGEGKSWSVFEIDGQTGQIDQINQLLLTRPL
jgi:uncharacterized protein YfaP (DUF2135 family)